MCNRKLCNDSKLKRTEITYMLRKQHVILSLVTSRLHFAKILCECTGTHCKCNRVHSSQLFSFFIVLQREGTAELELDFLM